MDESEEKCSEPLRRRYPMTEYKTVRRSCTDLLHFVAFSLCFLIWAGITYKVLGTLNIFSTIYVKKCLSYIYIYSYCYRWLILPGAFYLFLYFIALRFLTKMMIIITIGLMTNLWILVIYASISDKIYTLSIYSPLIIVLIFFVHLTTYYCLIKGKINDMSKIMQDSCRAMMCIPSFIVIVILQISFMVLIVLVAYEVMQNLVLITEIQSVLTDSSGDQPHHIVMLIYILLSLWLITVIYNFGQMVLYKTFVTWHRAADKNSIPCGIVLINALSCMRYHMGTLTFGSTLLTIIPILLATCSSRKIILLNIKKRRITLACLPFLFGNATVNSFIACSSYGTSFHCSMKDSFKTVMKDPIKFATTRLVSTWVLLFGQIIVPFLSMYTLLRLGSTKLFSDDQYSFFHDSSFYVVNGISSFILVGIFLSAGLNAAVSSVLFCSLEDLDSTGSYSRIEQLNDDTEEPAETMLLPRLLQ